MSRNQKRKLFGSAQSATPIDSGDNQVSARLPSDYSPPNLNVEGVRRDLILSDLVDYQLTVRPKVELTRYQVSMLLEMACWEVVRGGIDFIGWLTIEYLTTRLQGSKKIWEIREPTERRVCTLSTVILVSTQNSWMNLLERERLSESLLSFIKDSALLSPDRSLQSRKEFWYPAKFLEVKTVRLDVFLEREQRSVRYSSYTKGYGESSRMGRRQKTRTSAELDGEENERPEVTLSLREVSNLLYLNMLELRRKNTGR